MIYQWNSSLECLLVQRGRAAEDLSIFREGLDRTIDIQREIVGGFAEESGIPFLDLTEPLQELAATGQTMADPLETHFNDAVNQFIAERIAIFLQELEDA
jgi:lysophospholipase L1-like esterase